MNAEGAASKTEERSSPRFECLSHKLFGDQIPFRSERFQERRFRFSDGLGVTAHAGRSPVLAARSGPAPTISRICARTRESPPNFSSLTLDQVIGGPNPPPQQRLRSRETT